MSRAVHHTTRAAATLSVALAVALAGCSVGPDFVRPTPPAIKKYTDQALPDTTVSAPTAGGDTQRFTTGADIPAQWWTLFRSAPLDALIERALTANPTIDAAEAALRAAQENVYAQQGAYFPSVSANLSASRQKDAIGVVSPTAASGSAYLTLRTAQVNVSYVADVFGLNRRQVESLEAQAANQRFQLEAARLTLTSNVVATAIAIASLREQIAATESTVQLAEDLLRLLQRQLDLGAIPEANVIAQRTAVAQAAAQLPPLRKQLAQQNDLLAVLVGHSPGEEPPPELELSSLTLPQNLPVSLPSALVEQRPDVRAAQELLHSASAQVGVAIANRLPQLTLNASGGSSASPGADLFKSSNLFWSVAAGLTEPLFDGNTLLHKQRSAEASYEQASAQYRSTVLTAFQNVADTLQALQLDAAALQAAVDAESSAAESLATSRRQVELGDTNPLLLLLAEQAWQQARINRVVAQAARYADTAALFQALGGGWWNAHAAGDASLAARGGASDDTR
jgi:NodT family efflux transporter outer membrane factor (OMF) lipoprotein